jgi:hypothetical protein
LAHDTFQRGEMTTDFVDRAFAQWSPPVTIPDELLIATALAETTELASVTSTVNGDPYNPWKATDAFRLAGR